MFELQPLGFQRAQLTLHAQGSRLVRTSARYHASLVARAIWRNERELRIVPRELFCCRGAVRQIRASQPRQVLFCRCSQRIAEFHELVHPRDHPVVRMEIHNRFVLIGKF